MKKELERSRTQSTLEALGFNMKLEVCTDSSANGGILLRQGHSRKTKHIKCKLLWAQQVVARGRAIVNKIPRSVNSADLLTKGHQWFRPCRTLTKDGLPTKERRTITRTTSR
eukprot:6481424-Amphidinium_carterae.3